jgi:hypothetical protein
MQFPKNEHVGLSGKLIRRALYSRGERVRFQGRETGLRER